MQLRAWRHLSLSVRDLDASIAWYTTVLGFEVGFEEPAAEGRRAVVLRGGSDGALALGLVQHGAGGSAFDVTTTGLDHAAFRVDCAEELAAWAAHFDDHGVEHSGAIEIPPGAILNFKDPDGIALALFWDRDTDFG